MFLMFRFRQLFTALKNMIVNPFLFIKRRKYRGFWLYYSKGTSLVGRIKRSASIYEPELSARIVRELGRTKTPIVLDVGANIGLITLNVLSELQQVMVYAFEPGRHQYALFAKTISTNNLEDKVTLYSDALSHSSGIRTFAAHRSRDSSGDGFLDTGRAGPVRFATVSCPTMDQWWISNYKPKVKVVKLDTERSEMWILRGATDCLRECRPVLFLEIWPENLNAHGYAAQDVLSWLNQNDYDLSTLNDEPVDFHNCQSYFGLQESFIARNRRVRA